MKTVLISLGIAFVVAALVYMTLPDQMYVEKAFNIIVLAFAGSATITWLLIRMRARKR